MLPLWMTIEPQGEYLKMMLSGRTGPQLKARLPGEPQRPGALARFLESMSDWYGRPLCAVVDAQKLDELHAQTWTQHLGDLDSARIQVEWVSVRRPRRRDPYFQDMGDFRRAQRLVHLAAQGDEP